MADRITREMRIQEAAQQLANQTEMDQSERAVDIAKTLLISNLKMNLYKEALDRKQLERER